MEYIIDTANGGVGAISMDINPTDCDEPCNAIITVTWKNTYHAPKNFKPGIIVNGVLTTLSERRLDNGKTVTISFPLNNLVAGTYNICPSPN